MTSRRQPGRCWRADTRGNSRRGGAPCRERRSNLFRAKTQRWEDVVFAAKRLFPFTLRQAATMEEKEDSRTRTSFFVSLRLCVNQNPDHSGPKIGRPSCRERVVQYV